MSLANVSTPYDTFTDASGKIISLGKVYIGVLGQDPETNPITCYWDAAGTIVAAQPLQIINGYITRSGTPAQVYVNSDYSIRLYDATNSVVYTYLNILAKSITGPAGGVLSGSYPNPGLAPASVATDNIQDSAVSNGKITPGPNNTVKGSSGSVVVDLNAYALNGILSRVGEIVSFSHFGFDASLYVYCNGQALSRAADARLFAKISSLIGTQGAFGWGAGDGSTTFTVPNYQGYFQRAYDPGTAGRTFGDFQADAMQRIRGTLSQIQARLNTPPAPTGAFSATTNSGNNGNSGGGDPSYNVDFDSNNSTGARTATETRPQNFTAYVCVVR